MNWSTRIGHNGTFYQVHVGCDGSAHVFEERGELVTNHWRAGANVETNLRVPATVRDKVTAAIAEGREVIFGKVAA
jgi:hypothetical protein